MNLSLITRLIYKDIYCNFFVKIQILVAVEICNTLNKIVFGKK